ncbi:hypothetical protein GCM10027051_00030 [Niabella terrae]
MTFQAAAQRFGGSPPGTRWQQIDTDTARIIFPEGLDSLAQSVATELHGMADSNQQPLGDALQKINIVLHGRPVVSNGYVGLGPYRSEFYLTPPADNFSLGTLPWPRQLALHEYRHAQQFNNFNRGLSRAAGYLFGQDGYSLAANAAIPNWFFEGDAVFQETMLSGQGRGHNPLFFNAFPTLWRAGRNYSWAKLRNGSYRDYIPGHYELGYLLVNYGNEKYGMDFWRRVTADASAYKGFWYPFQKAVKKYSGRRYRDFVTEAFDFYRDKFQPTTTAMGSVDPRERDRSLVTDYQYPFQVSPVDRLYLKSSYGSRPGFYLLKGSREQLLRVRDISINEQYSYRNGRIVYAAFETHPRWRWQGYSVLKILDTRSGRQRRLTRKTRYFSPDISPDGTKIVASKYAVNGQASLVVLDAAGRLQQEIKTDSVSYFVNPKITDNQTVITVLRFMDGRNCLARIDLNTRKLHRLTPPAFTNIGQIDVLGDAILFTASLGRRDRIVRYHFATGRLSVLRTDDRLQYQVNQGFGKLNWSEFTAGGYRLRQMDAGIARWEELSDQDFLHATAGIITAAAREQQLPVPAPRQFDVENYPALTHPFNFHSWRPNYNQPEFSFSVYGNNVLNTVNTELYYTYNQNERSSSWGGSLIYGGLFPYISVGSEYTLDRNAWIQNQRQTWNQWDNYLGLTLPLNWVSGRSYKSLSLFTAAHYRRDYNTTDGPASAIRPGFGYMQYQMKWGQHIQQALQDIYPRLGYSLDLQYLDAVNRYDSYQLLAKVRTYLPGFVPAQVLVLDASGQFSGSSASIFSNRLPTARGFEGFNAGRAWTLSANYHFPIWYPDWGFGDIFYLKRLRGNLFYDFTRLDNQLPMRQARLQSAGAELYFDTQWWNQHPVSFGVRGGWRLAGEHPQTDRNWFLSFILPGSLIPR